MSTLNLLCGLPSGDEGFEGVKRAFAHQRLHERRVAEDLDRLRRQRGFLNCWGAACSRVVFVHLRSGEECELS